jgi:hypothetical protein
MGKKTAEKPKNRPKTIAPSATTRAIALKCASFVRAESRNDENGLVVPGILATDAEVEHYFFETGLIRLQLEITPELVESWGIETMPFLADHGSNIFSGPKIDQVIGRVANLRADGGLLRVDFRFDPDFRHYYDRVERGTLTDSSVGADVFEAILVELSEDDDKPPLYRATNWRPREGSLVWAGADTEAKFRRNAMDPQELQRMIDAAVERKLAQRAEGDESSEETEEEETAAAEDEADAEQAEDAPNEQRSMDDDEMARDVAAGVKAALRARARRGAVVPIRPAPRANRSIDVAVSAAIDLGVKDDVIRAAKADANGDAKAFSLALRTHLRSSQAVPEVAPRRGRVTGGESGVTRAMADMVLVAAARASRDGRDPGAPGKTFGQLAAERGYHNPANLSMLGMVETIARAHDPNLGVVTNPLDLVKRMMRAQFVSSEQVTFDHRGARMVRDAHGGVTPADLPSVFLDVVYKVLMASYTRYNLPWADIARVEQVADFRQVNLIWYDIAGQYSPLAKGENLRPLVLRDKAGVFQADNFGHVLKIEYHAIINDDLGIIGRAPQLVGEWCASQQVKVFADMVTSGTPIGGSTIWAGNFDHAVSNPHDYATILEAIRKKALAVVPVAAGAAEDPRNTPGKSYSLQPDTMLYGIDHQKPLFDYMAPLRLPANPDVVRRTYETTLYENSHEVLDFTADHAYLYPGPSSPHCPFAVGWVRGQQMAVTLSETGGYEQDGVLIRATNTFGAAVINNNAAYRISDSD